MRIATNMTNATLSHAPIKPLPLRVCECVVLMEINGTIQSAYVSKPVAPIQAAAQAPAVEPVVQKTTSNTQEHVGVKVLPANDFDKFKYRERPEAAVEDSRQRSHSTTDSSIKSSLKPSDVRPHDKAVHITIHEPAEETGAIMCCRKIIIVSMPHLAPHKPIAFEKVQTSNASQSPATSQRVASSPKVAPKASRTKSPGVQQTETSSSASPRTPKKFSGRDVDTTATFVTQVADNDAAGSSIKEKMAALQAQATAPAKEKPIEGTKSPTPHKLSSNILHLVDRAAFGMGPMNDPAAYLKAVKNEIRKNEQGHAEETAAAPISGLQFVIELISCQ